MSDAEVAPAHVAELGSLAARMGISIMKATPDIATGTMPVEGNTQPLGLLHGGASAAFAETLGSLAASLHAHEISPDSFAVGVDLTITHLGAARHGAGTGTATALRRGRTIAVYGIDILDESGAMVAAARLTCAIRRTPATRR